MNFLSLGIVALIASSAWAGEQVGTLTQVQGEVKVFSHPGKEIQGPAPHALFEGTHYSVQDATVGAKIENGNILRTMPGARARVVFDNGDQYNVGSATAYKVGWKKDAPAEGAPEVSLMYGKLRGVIAKGGPRSGLRVKTRSATMGVRGTDFFIAEEGLSGATEVSILRGEVEVKPTSAGSKPVTVKSGYSATVTPNAAPPSPTPEKAADEAQTAALPSKVDLRRTTQEGLIAIQKSSEVRTELRKEVTKTEEPVTRKVAELEKKAVATTLKDIQNHDPKLFAQLQDRKIDRVEELHQTTVETLVKDAPKGPANKRKPFKSELEDLEQGAYEKYFKIE
jgi:hypothetical protein